MCANRPIVGLALLAVLAAGACATPEGPAGVSKEPDPVASLVAAERAFAADASSRDIPSAFLAVLADDGVVFAPGPTNGRERFAGAEPSEAVLEWRPVVAETSVAGDVGFTTGPYTYRPDRSPDAPISRGQFLSVWTREGGGPWRLAADLGVPYGPSVDEPEDFRRARSAVRRPATLDDLFAADRATRGAECRESAAEDLRVHRVGVPPALGVDAACDLETGTTAGTTAEPLGGGIATSGDLGYTWGRSEAAGAEPVEGAVPGFAYLRVWRRQEDGWKRIADVATPWARETDPARP